VSPTGRRRGTPGTRGAILRVARRHFASRGYEATSLRTIAGAAKVDPALVIHYFGSKEGLFAGAMDLPPRLLETFDEMASLPVGEAVELLVRRYLEVVDSDRSRNAVLALVRSAVSNETAATMLREFLSAGMLRSLEGRTQRPDAERRAALVAAQLVGIAVLRHVLRVGAVASATRDDLVALVAPVVVQYLEGPGDGCRSGP